MIRSWSTILQLCHYLGTVHYKEKRDLAPYKLGDGFREPCDELQKW
jgi:hypothetical protein